MTEEQRREADNCRGSFANVSCRCLRNRAISLSLLSAGLCRQFSICSMVYSQLPILQGGLSFSPLFFPRGVPSTAVPCIAAHHRGSPILCLCMGWGLHPVGPPALQEDTARKKILLGDTGSSFIGQEGITTVLLPQSSVGSKQPWPQCPTLALRFAALPSIWERNVEGCCANQLLSEQALFSG